MKYVMWKILVALHSKLPLVALDYAMDWCVDNFTESETDKYFKTLESWGW